MLNLYPKIDYQIDDFDSLRVVDITVSARIKRYLRSYRAFALRPYIVKNGELPEIVSNRVYGSPKYGYVLILVNEIHSLYDDWPKSTTVLKNYLEEKYGSISYAQSTIFGHFTSQGNIVSESFWNSLQDPGKYTRTILEHETELNDKKANINIMDFRYVVDFESKLQELLISN